jgi:O-antigen/teichoic acid export membrane protein
MVSMLLGAAAVVVLPKLLSETQYGYYQLYLLYVSFTTFLSLGIPEGVYLALGGKKASNIGYATVKRQFRFLCVFDSLAYVIIASIFVYFSDSSDFALVAIFVSFSGTINCVRNYILFILQAKGQIRSYSLSVIIERVISLVPILIIISIGVQSIPLLLIFDSLGRLISFFYIYKSYKKFLVLGQIILNNEDRPKSLFINAFSGVQLVLSNYASTIIMGMLKFGIQVSWDIVVFAQASLSISIATMFLRFTNAATIPVFPALKDLDEKTGVRFYRQVSFVLTSLFFVLALFIEPIVFLLGTWLPSYAESLRYVTLLFPLCVFESKISIITANYFKSYRLEKPLMLINVLSIFIAIVLTAVVVCAHLSTLVALLSLVAVLFLRFLLSEIYLLIHLGIPERRTMFWDAIITLGLLTAYMIPSFSGYVFYVVLLFMFLITSGKKLKQAFQSLIRL